MENLGTTSYFLPESRKKTKIVNINTNRSFSTPIKIGQIFNK
jgi:hypothetical protein